MKDFKSAIETSDDGAGYEAVSERALANRIIFMGLLTIVLIPLWGIFDYFVDPLNYRTFLCWRFICSFVNIVGLIAFIKLGKPATHFNKFNMLIYLSLVCTILPMIIMTEHTIPYNVGFTTVFFGVSVFMIWPLRYFLIPLLCTVFVLSITKWNESVSVRAIVTSLFLTINVLTIAGLASWLTYRNFLTNKTLMKKLDYLSNTDRLTGLHNRRSFDSHLKNEIAHGIRNKTSIAILLLDVDHFKKYNDNYGHPQGDRCLQQVAECLLKAVMREIDFVARYGGEEFIITLSGTDLQGAEVVANRIIDILSNEKIPHAYSSTAPYVTVSIGIACGQTSSADSLVGAADSALYQAKQNGRNRFVAAV